jgi:hypothetical protein
MFSYKPYENLVILKANGSSFGNWYIKLDDVTFRFFWKKTDAVKFLNDYLKG